MNYFCGLNVNMNVETGIRYGVVYANELDLDMVWDAMYGDNMVWDKPEESPDTCEDEDESYMYNDEEGSGTYNDGYGLEVRLSYLGGAPMLTVILSPYIRKCALCSPCVPNAGNLTDVGDYDTYDVPPDWYRETE